MNRRQLMAATLAAAAPLPAWAQPPAAPAPAAPATPPQPRPAIPLVETPALPWSIVAEGLHFPEGPVVMKDGSVLFVQIETKQVSRLTPAGKVEMLAQLDGGPNSLTVGPDGAVYIANNGGRFSFTVRNGFNSPGAPPAGFAGGGKIQRLDLKTRAVTTIYDSIDGHPLTAPDDLVFDTHGGLWITELGLRPGSGAIYYARKLGQPLTVARPGMSGPNGIGVSPDGKLLHVSMGQSLYAFDIEGPGKLSTRTYPEGRQAPLHEGSGADSLKLQADGKVCVCSLFRPGGITIADRAGMTEFLGFPDRFVCNLAFGGKDMRDCWLMLSGLGKIAKVRWPAPGQTPVYRA
ncbi:MAG: SMP-30/gluconolactonase/LRE family protein [Phenylobacterium sp.]